MKIFKTFTLTACLFFALSGCVPAPYKDLSTGVDQNQGQFDKDFDASENQSPHIGKSPLVIDNNSDLQQAWLSQTISLRAQNMPLSEVVNRILANTSANSVFESDVPQTTPITLTFKGSRRDALNLISDQTDFAYTVTGKIITWSTLITRTFDVSFMPGSSKYMVGDQESGGGGSSSSGSSSGGSGAQNAGLTTNGEYSSIKGDFSLWNDLQGAIKGMLSDKGKVSVSEATTTITVTDRPQNVRQIQNYLESMNQSLSRQVALNVQVIEITLNKAFSYGIDWDLVRNLSHGRYGLALKNTTSGQVNSTLDGSNTFLLSASSGVWNQSQTFINALAQQGKVSVATQPRVVTLNNQVAEIGINTLTTYLAQVSTTLATNAGSSTSLTPGTVTSGFTLYLLPKIQGGNVYLQISSTIANLITIKNISGDTGASTTSSTTTNQIGAPIITQKRFNQRTLVPSGDTLVLAGFKQLKNEANKSSLFGVDQLGGYGGNQDNIETIILITPTIVNLKQ